MEIEASHKEKYDKDNIYVAPPPLYPLNIIIYTVDFLVYTAVTLYNKTSSSKL